MTGTHADIVEYLNSLPELAGVSEAEISLFATAFLAFMATRNVTLEPLPA
jgi:hypothetical protein